MKKLMIAALAISAMVACSKDDSADAVLESTKKSMVINILNTAPTSRAITESAQGATDLASTHEEDLVFGFCDGAGNLVVAKTINDPDVVGSNGSYVFHALPQHVSQVYIIANGTPKFTTANAPATIDLAHQAWERPQVDAEWKDIIAFGHDEATHAKNADGSDAFCEVEGSKYPLYEAKVTVKPFHARIEVKNIECSDLGTHPKKGFDKITLQNLVFAGLTQDLGNVQLDATANPKKTSYKLANNQVWSWNGPEQIVSDLTLNLRIDQGTDWKVPSGTELRSVNVIRYKAPAGYVRTDNVFTAVEDAAKVGCLKKFLAGEIYVLDLKFKEENIHTDADMLCVDVDVTIADWVVVPVTPGFQ